MTKSVVCTIERRLLVNYRIDPDVLVDRLPTLFRPQLVSGMAVGGVCFIRLTGIRPPGVPSALGMKSENVAHRFAVEWDDDEGTHVGVYVPRRDTNSRMTSLAGGRLFPGDYRLARFNVDDRGSDIRIAVSSDDQSLRLSVRAHQMDELGGALFASVDQAVDFFRRGSLSYSPTGTSARLDGVRLCCERWTAEPVSVEHMASSLFDDEQLFPRGSCSLDSGLIMRNLPVRWMTQSSLRSERLAGIAC